MMPTVRRTAEFTFNIRRETVPGLGEQQYQSLLSDEPTEVPAESADYLTQNGYAAEEE